MAYQCHFCGKISPSATDSFNEDLLAYKAGWGFDIKDSQYRFACNSHIVFLSKELKSIRPHWTVKVNKIGRKKFQVIRNDGENIALLERLDGAWCLHVHSEPLPSLYKHLKEAVADSIVRYIAVWELPILTHFIRIKRAKIKVNNFIRKVRYSILLGALIYTSYKLLS